VPYVKDEIRRHSQKYADRMKRHPNILTKNLMKSVTKMQDVSRLINESIKAYFTKDR